MRRISAIGLWRKTSREYAAAVSYTIIWVCVALFACVSLLDLLGIVSRRDAMSVLGLSYAGLIQHRLLFQVLTAPLLHATVTHLLFNMLSLWMLGPAVEEKLGCARYAMFSVLCAASGLFGFLVFNWHTSHVVVGYSGVIFGMLVAQAMYFPENVVAIFAFFPLKMKYAVLLLGAVELYLTVLPEDGGIAHATHLFGAMAAFVYLRVSFLKEARKARTALATSRRARLKWPVGGKRACIPREL